MTGPSRLTLDPATAERLGSYADRLGVNPADLVSAVLDSTLADLDVKSAARDYLRRLEADLPSLTREGLVEEVTVLAPGIRVAAVRLDGFVPDPVIEPFTRTGSGVNFGESDPLVLFAATRGPVTIGAESTALAPHRGGEFLGLFVDVAWSNRDVFGKRHALRGLAVTADGSCLDAVTGETVRAARREEAVLRARLLEVRYRMHHAARNPVSTLF